MWYRTLSIHHSTGWDFAEVKKTLQPVLLCFSGAGRSANLIALRCMSFIQVRETSKLLKDKSKLGIPSPEGARVLKAKATDQVLSHPRPCARGKKINTADITGEATPSGHTHSSVTSLFSVCSLRVILT